MSDEGPTSSFFNTSGEKPDRNVNNDDNLELYISNDRTEVNHLEPLDNTFVNKDENVEEVPDNDRIAKIKFRCTCCDMEEMAHYFGSEPRFVFGIKFNEPTYVMRDPFRPPPQRWKPKAEYFVALGAHCKLCDRVVCKDNECSFFYINSYCLSCVKKVAGKFPLEIQQKLRKQLSLT